MNRNQTLQNVLNYIDDNITSEMKRDTTLSIMIEETTVCILAASCK